MKKDIASIIILTYNNLEDTILCLESIWGKPAGYAYEVIVVDNASSDDTPAYLLAQQEQHDNLKIILNERNEGFARGNNTGAGAAEGSYLVFLNNDTVVTPNWLGGLVRHLQDPVVGLVGPVTNGAGNESYIKEDYQTLDGLDEFAQRIAIKNAGRAFDIQTLAFYCVALRAETYLQTGPLDERFGLGMFEDDDYAERIRQNGKRVICAEDVYIHHSGGKSFLKMAPYEYWELFQKNRLLFEEKWGKRWVPHQFRAEYLPDLVRNLFEEYYTAKWAVVRLEKQNIEQDKVIKHQELTIANQTATINNLVQRISALEKIAQELELIKNSRSWRLMRRIHGARHFFIPINSKREKIFRKALALLERGLRGGIREPSDAVSPREPDSKSRIQETTSPTPNLTQNSQFELNDRLVPILTPQFFDFSGDNLYIGGAERYLMELAALVRQLGFDPIIYQSGHQHWEREYSGFPIIGLESSGDLKKLSQLFHSQLNPNTPAIYLAFYLAEWGCQKRSVGISHGVYWDQTEDQPLGLRFHYFEELIKAFSNLQKIVSVDTNTINWVRTIKSDLANKFVYIPNFVDMDVFKPSPVPHSSERLTILYPRRLYPPRGFWLVEKLVVEFIRQYPDVDFYFVGQANAEEKVAIQNLITRYPNRVKWDIFEFGEMYKAYQQADVTLIPTLNSEGTSLSCLEAMASGNVVVATNVGGLPDLIISGYNGILIEPETSSLAQALHLLCENKRLREELSTNALKTVQAFRIENWRRSWQAILKQTLSKD